MRYKARLLSSFLLANWTFGAMPNEFAKQKGLWWVPWSGWNELHKTSREKCIITSNCNFYCQFLMAPAKTNSVLYFSMMKEHDMAIVTSGFSLSKKKNPQNYRKEKNIIKGWTLYQLSDLYSPWVFLCNLSPRNRNRKKRWIRKLEGQLIVNNISGKKLLENFRLESHLSLVLFKAFFQLLILLPSLRGSFISSLVPVPRAWNNEESF